MNDYNQKRKTQQHGQQSQLLLFSNFFFHFSLIHIGIEQSWFATILTFLWFDEIICFKFLPNFLSLIDQCLLNFRRADHVVQEMLLIWDCRLLKLSWIFSNFPMSLCKCTLAFRAFGLNNWGRKSVLGNKLPKA